VPFCGCLPSTCIGALPGAEVSYRAGILEMLALFGVLGMAVGLLP
jgi:hypothetical protein